MYIQCINDVHPVHTLCIHSTHVQSALRAYTGYTECNINGYTKIKAGATKFTTQKLSL